MAIYALLSLKTIKQRVYEKIITKQLIDFPYSSSLVVRDLVKYILSQKKNKRRRLLDCIKNKNLKKIVPEISKELLRAKARLIIEGKFSQVSKSDTLYKLLEVNWLIKNNNLSKAREILCEIKTKGQKKDILALRKMLIAQFAICEGDMQVCEEELSSALKVFQKKNLIIEAGKGYFLLGNMYRAIGVFDTADFMYRTAAEILHNFSSQILYAEILGNQSLLMSVQERFDEAQEYLNKGLNFVPENTSIRGFLSCQEAMLSFLQGKLTEAKKQITQLLKNNKLKPEVVAVAKDIASRIYAKQKKYKQSVIFATEAGENFENLKNYAASFDSYYLAAECYMHMNNFTESEKILRNIIAKEKKQQTCFHVASAYTLLGLILLRQNRLKQAKAIFNQALEQELYNDRQIGIAIDYANLSLIEKMLGKKSTARKNLEAALSYSKDINEEVYNQILKGLKDI